MNRILIFIAVSLLSLSAQCNVVPISEYYKYKEEPFMISYVWGMSGGILLATTVNEDKGGNKLFCMSGDFIITNEESVKILESELYGENGAKKYPDETPVSMVYLSALEKMFPCG